VNVHFGMAGHVTMLLIPLAYGLLQFVLDMALGFHDGALSQIVWQLVEEKLGTVSNGNILQTTKDSSGIL
jgi:hypothetical protein